VGEPYVDGGPRAVRCLPLTWHFAPPRRSRRPRLDKAGGYALFGLAIALLGQAIASRWVP